jgi:hypothetical protein
MILVDTGPPIALFDPADNQHRPLRQCSEDDRGAMGRLKGGCGQNCPPHIFLTCHLFPGVLSRAFEHGIEDAELS